MASPLGPPPPPRASASAAAAPPTPQEIERKLGSPSLPPTTMGAASPTLAALSTSLETPGFALLERRGSLASRRTSMISSTADDESDAHDPTSSLSTSHAAFASSGGAPLRTSPPSFLAPTTPTTSTSTSTTTATTAMASSSFITSLSLLLLLPLSHATMILTVVNNCPFTVWPAIQPNAGHPVLERGGFALNARTHRSFPAPTTHWSGRIWARTGCIHRSGRFTCATGDCGGKLECNGLGGATPATLAQFTLHHGHNDQSSYSVSLVDGFNVPMTVTPHEGKGTCPVVGCKADLLATCPWSLQKHSDGRVVACKSGCEAFNTDEFCCRGHFNSAQTCKLSKWSAFFKHACPATFAYAHDSPSLMHECSSPKELKVIFCH